MDAVMLPQDLTGRVGDGTRGRGSWGVALDEGRVVGGLAAYELRKFEKERSEFYVYDLGVAAESRRQGVATAMVGRLQDLAAERGGWVPFIQADYDNDPAIALYSKLGEREEVLHFDIPVPSRTDS